MLLSAFLLFGSCGPGQPPAIESIETSHEFLVLYFMNPEVLTRVPVTPRLIKKWYSAKIELRGGLVRRLILAQRSLPANIHILVERINKSGETIETYGFAGKEDFGEENWRLVEAFN